MTQERICETTERYDGNRRDYQESRIRDAAEMLVAMIEFEIGYGGQFVTVEDGYITIETHVLGNRDVSIYKPLDRDNCPIFQKFYECALITSSIRTQQMTDGTEQHEQLINSVMQITKGIPLLIKMGIGIIAGNGIVKKLFAYLASFNDVELLNQLLELKTQDLKSITLAVLRNEFTKAEVIDLITVS